MVGLKRRKSRRKKYWVKVIRHDMIYVMVPVMNLVMGHCKTNQS